MVFRMMMNGAAKASKGTKAKVDGRAPCSSRLKLAGRWVSTWYPVEIRPATAKPMASAKNDWIDSGLIQPQRLRNRHTPHLKLHPDKPHRPACPRCAGPWSAAPRYP